MPAVVAAAGEIASPEASDVQQQAVKAQNETGTVDVDVARHEKTANGIRFSKYH